MVANRAPQVVHGGPNDGEGRKEQVFPQGLREPWLMGWHFLRLEDRVALG